MTKRHVTLAEVRSTARTVARQIALLRPAKAAERGALYLYGIPRGGIPAVLAVADACRADGLMLEPLVIDNPDEADVLVDDIFESGATARRYAERYPGRPFFALFDKRTSAWAGSWLVMPWELTDSGNDKSADDIIIRLLEFIGDDPSREGLLETPKRVLEAWREWASGYKLDPKAVLKTFSDGASGVDEKVIVHNIPVVSKCEHHLADITGIAHVGYIPDGKIVGLSKLPRLVDLFARRLQVQERLTNQIADALTEIIQPKGVGVIIRATHACMSTRGVKVHGSTTTTSAFKGELATMEARAEFLSLCLAAERDGA